MAEGLSPGQTARSFLAPSTIILSPGPSVTLFAHPVLQMKLVSRVDKDEVCLQSICTTAPYSIEKLVAAVKIPLVCPQIRSGRLETNFEFNVCDIDCNCCIGDEEKCQVGKPS
jgi:hypothetical protein